MNLTLGYESYDSSSHNQIPIFKLSTELSTEEMAVAFAGLALHDVLLSARCYGLMPAGRKRELAAPSSLTTVEGGITRNER